MLILRDPEFHLDIPQSMFNIFEKLDCMSQKVMLDKLDMGGHLSGTTCVLVHEKRALCLLARLLKYCTCFQHESRLTVGSGSERSKWRTSQKITRPSAVVERALINGKGATVPRTRVLFGFK